MVCGNIGIQSTRIKELISNEYHNLLARKLKRIDHIHHSMYICGYESYNVNYLSALKLSQYYIYCIISTFEDDCPYALDYSSNKNFKLKDV